MPPAPPSLPRFSPTVYASVDVMESSPGPLLQRFAIPIDYPHLYRFAVGNTDTADGITTIAPSGGGTGNWLMMAVADKGADLTDAAVTLLVGGKEWRTLPAATLSANRIATLGTTNARAGYCLGVTRLDIGAFTYAFVNGGPAAGTLTTMPVSSRAWAFFYFDGTNWSMRASGLML